MCSSDLLTALYTRTTTVARASPRADAQSPCALCRGGRDGFAWKESSRGQGASRGSAWSLARIQGGFRDVLSRRGPSRGENPREARQAWRAWSLAKSSEECCGPWQAGPWYPGFHCADSSPRARDGHAEVRGRRRSVGGPTMPAWAVTRGAQQLRPRPRSPRLQPATRWGPPRPW